MLDTPGFDHATKSDAEILRIIADFLEASYVKLKLGFQNNDYILLKKKCLTCRYQEGVKLAGILYFHRISDFRMGGASRKSLSMFQKLCGEKALRNVVIVTNMWEEIDLKTGEARLAELEEDDMFFKPILDKGAKIARHDKTVPSAEKIIRLLFDNHPLPLRIQEELVDEGKRIAATDAGGMLENEFPERIEQHVRELQAVIEEMRQAMRDEDGKGRKVMRRTQHQMVMFIYLREREAILTSP